MIKIDSIVQVILFFIVISLFGLWYGDPSADPDKLYYTIYLFSAAILLILVCVYNSF